MRGGLPVASAENMHAIKTLSSGNDFFLFIITIKIFYKTYRKITPHKNQNIHLLFPIYFDGFTICLHQVPAIVNSKQ